MSVTLPGDIPGLLRRCSPLPDGATVLTDPASDDAGALYVMVSRTPGAPADHVYSEWLGDLLLDLSDATGRAHAAWWLAQRLDEYAPRDGAPWLTWKRFHGETGWALMNAANMRWCFTEPGGRWDWMTAVPALTGLDMDDPRTLPDGSRWVDAEALRRVCLHVAGRTT